MESVIKYIWIPIIQCFFLLIVIGWVFEQKYINEKYYPFIWFILGFISGFVCYGILAKLGIKIGTIVGLGQGILAFFEGFE